MATYEKYIKEDEMTDDMVVSDTLSQEDLLKLRGLATKIGSTAQDHKNNLTRMKRVVEKVYSGITVADAKDKVILMDILRFFLSPDKSRFKSILMKF